MTSSSSSSHSSLGSSSGSWDHTIFLSFRGEDCRTFVEDLYAALQILTYRDSKRITFGKQIDLSLFKAIEQSSFAIPVLSKNYVNSSWCLEELEHIMNCMDEKGLIVMPILYDVNPLKVRRQKRKNTEAPVNHMWKNDHKDASRSHMKVLQRAINLSGWIPHNIANRQESRCIKLVVDTISNRLFPNKDLIRYQDVEHLKIPLRKLAMATNNFNDKYIIRKGGFGNVYKAQYENGIVAIKKLDRRFGQGDPEFMMEIALLSAYIHRNLVSLIGFCDEGGEKILVYKYESNGSLDQHLHNKDLTWIPRLCMCLDVAHGLKYLHDDIGTQHRILHRDIKSSNILLDDNFNAKISDFGLSKIALANVPCTVLISKVCGTPGYCDPEYYKHGILTQKSDVYSFGVVLFEVLCGKQVGVSKHLDELFSAELAHNHYEKGTLDEIIDSNLRNQMNSASLSTFSAIAHQCLKSPGQERPTMSVVVKLLEIALGYQQAASLE